MIDQSTLKSILDNPVYRKTRKRHYIADCPYCGKPGHLYVNIDTGQWDCKVCHEEGGARKLLGKLDKLYLLEDGESLDVTAGIKPLIEIKAEESLDTLLPTVKFPIGFRRVFDDPYLNSRKFLPKDYVKHPVGYTRLKQKYLDYVLIGIMQQGDLKGYMGRYLGTDKTKPKYSNSTGNDFSHMLFNRDSINDRTRIGVLVEGGFDCVGAENTLKLYEEDEMKAVGTFGKKISQYQLYTLRQTNIETLIFLYDGEDAVDEIKKYAFEARQWFDVLIGFKSTGDPNEWTEAEYAEILSSLQTPEQFWTDKVNPKKIRG